MITFIVMVEIAEWADVQQTVAESKPHNAKDVECS